MKSFWKNSIWTILSLGLFGFIAMGLAYVVLSSQLPDVEEIQSMRLQVPLRIYSQDRKLIAQFGEKNRTPLELKEIPEPMLHAILAIEDKRFYKHSGIDFRSLLRAAKQVIRSGHKSEGGSTITMQVARNFFLSREKTYGRKIKEILLALKMERSISKGKILELYLNKIFLGQRSYGVEAAANAYYGKSLKELSIAQFAMLAGLPKAPSRLNPFANPEAAMARRNLVLDRMHEQGYLAQEEYETASNEPITATRQKRRIELYAPYVAESVRKDIVSTYGKKEAYERGLKVYTTVRATHQVAANAAVRQGLISFEKRRGFRPRRDSENIGTEFLNDPEQLELALKKEPTISRLMPAIVTDVQDKSIQLHLKNGETAALNWSKLSWARKQEYERGPTSRPKSAGDIVKPGDIVRLNKVRGQWELSDISESDAALISLSPTTGGIISMVGGFSFELGKLNLAQEAYNFQPGSSFKPFIYAAALSQPGWTLASLINDAPIVKSNGREDTSWRPENASKKFYGPTRLRVGLTKSRNLVSARLLEEISIPYAIDYLKNFGFDSKRLPREDSLALGTATLSPLELARAYAVFANGGYLIDPYLIERIENEDGNIEYMHQPKEPPIETYSTSRQASNSSLAEEYYAKQVIDKDVTYLITNTLREAIQSGTGRRARVLGRSDLAGKTGTTDEYKNVWFAGYNQDIVTVTWMGHRNEYRTLGPGEYGHKTALPIWIDYMRVALKSFPEKPLEMPNNIEKIRIDPKTGLLANSWQTDSIFEVFRSDRVPTRYASGSEPNGQRAPSMYDHTPDPLY